MLESTYNKIFAPLDDNDGNVFLEKQRKSRAKLLEDDKHLVISPYSTERLPTPHDEIFVSKNPIHGK